MIPNFYRPPLGLPLYWRDEVSGVLPAAVAAYLDNRVEGWPMSDTEVGIVREYIQHYINAPCWENEEFAEELRNLREAAKSLDSPAKIAAWSEMAMEIGLDPL